MKNGGKHIYFVCKLSISWILILKKGNKLVKFLKGNEYVYYEIVANEF